MIVLRDFDENCFAFEMHEKVYRQAYREKRSGLQEYCLDGHLLLASNSLLKSLYPCQQLSAKTVRPPLLFITFV